MLPRVTRHNAEKIKMLHPYINHPLQVTLLISEVGNISDTEILVAALLHDTIEDTKTSSVELDTSIWNRS